MNRYIKARKGKRGKIWTWSVICPKHLPRTLEKLGYTINLEEK